MTTNNIDCVRKKGKNNNNDLSLLGYEFTDIRFILRKISSDLDQSYLKWKSNMEKVK